MVNISNDMIITNSSLSQVSRELIDQRVYKSGTITIKGKPVIINGVATSFSDENYFTQDNIVFHSPITNAKITFSGNYSPANTDDSCAWELVNKNNGQPNISLMFANSSIILYNGSNILLQVPNLTFEVENQVEITVDFKNSYIVGTTDRVQTCSVFVLLNKNTYSVSTAPSSTIINFSNYTSLALGNKNAKGAPWQGNIKLADFALYENGIVTYTPSARNTFTFNKILIGDGAIPLEDNSEEVLNHIYACPITEVTRTENNVLLTTVIPGDAQLTMREIALYYTDDTGSHVFSKIENLSVRKGRELSYKLIIHVKLDINVVNTIAMPKFVVKELDNANYSSFLTVKRLYNYIVAVLERMIRMNALGVGSYEMPSMLMTKTGGVGYNRAQELYRAEDDLDILKDNYFATCDYAKLKSKLTPYSTTTFDPSNLEKHGNVNLDEGTGIANNFSNLNYITTEHFVLSDNINWTISTEITTGATGTNQCILCSGENFINQALNLYINSGKLYFTIKGIDQIILKLNNDKQYLYTRNGTTTINDTLFYVWETSDNETYSQVYTTIYRDFNSSTGIFDNEGNQITALSFFSLVLAPSVTSEIANIELNKDYKISISRTNGVCTANCTDAEGTTQTSTFNFNAPLNNFYETYFGIRYNGNNDVSNYFNGSINLYNTSLITRSVEGGSESTFTLTEYVNKSLLDYFHIPEYAYNYFEVNNLGYDGTSYLEVYDGDITGNLDRIDFNNPEGFTLCTKVSLLNTKDKVLLTKGSTQTSSTYFRLEEKDLKLVFSVFYDDATVVLTKDFSNPKIIRQYISNPINITITCKDNLYKMYRDNELLVEYFLPNPASTNINGMYLMSNNDSEDCLIHDIISIEGALEPNEIYYVNNLLDTNF